MIQKFLPCALGATVASLDYAYLIFAAFWGFVVFGTVHDSLVIVGTGLIAAAGL